MSGEGGRPTLSVTVLNYNYGRYLPACLDSILGQTFRDLEVIVIDDRSSDDSLAVLERYRADPRVRVVAHRENVGFTGSLIEGTEVHSRGEFVTVVSADDLVRRPDAFELLLAPLLARPDAAMAFSAFDKFDSDSGEVVEVHRSFDGPRTMEAEEAFRLFLTRSRIWAMHSGTILRRSAYQAAGGYRRDIRYAIETGLWFLVAQEGAVCYRDEVLFGYRVHRHQMSRGLVAARCAPRELFDLIDRACERAAQRGWRVDGLRRQANRARPVIGVLSDAFAGSPRCAFAGAWSCLQGRPADLLGSRDLWTAVTRAVVGPRAFGALRRLARGGRGGA